MDKGKLFSVVIPNLNTPSIDRSVDSLEKQSFDRARFEVIVVGMDRFGIVRESDLVRFDRSQSPLSPAAARNRGAKNASGEILVFMDADCIADPGWLSGFARTFEDARVHVAGGGVRFQEKNYWTMADNLSMFYEFLDHHARGFRKQLPSLNLAIRKPAFDAVGGFDERYPRAAGEDADLTLRLRKAGYDLLFEPRATVLHAPPRSTLTDLLRHSYYQGKYSTKVDPRYASEHRYSGFLRSRAGVQMLAPILAAGATWRIFSSHPAIRRYWYTTPVIYLGKLAWCAGAARRPVNF